MNSLFRMKTSIFVCLCLALFGVINAQVNTIPGQMGMGFNNFNTGFGRPGFNQFGMNTMGMNTMGFNNMGMNNLGMNTMGFNNMGMNNMGFNNMGMNTLGMNNMGFNNMGMNTMGMNTMGFNTPGFSGFAGGAIPPQFGMNRMGQFPGQVNGRMGPPVGEYLYLAYF